jgi:hypothetical protein
VGLPGTVRLPARTTGLSKVLRSDLVERVGSLPQAELVALGDGLRLVLEL